MCPVVIYRQEHESNRPSGTPICVKLTYRNNKSAQLDYYRDKKMCPAELPRYETILLVLCQAEIETERHSRLLSSSVATRHVRDSNLGPIQGDADSFSCSFPSLLQADFGKIP